MNLTTEKMHKIIRMRIQPLLPYRAAVHPYTFIAMDKGVRL
ncbi:hypothetical protein [Lonsdalea britannica]|nr:hypothetical protein [Lonsdalea britannica]